MGAGTDTGSKTNQNKKIDYEIDDVDDAKDAVEEYLQLDDDDPNAPIIKVDSEDSDTYTVQVYSVIYNADGSTTQTTIGWFYVDKLTGKVTEK